MTQEALNQDISQLKERFGSVQVANGSAGQTLIKIDELALPRGCSPPTTPVLVVVQQGQPRPQVYVRPGTKASGGVEPRSTSVVQVEGEAWLQFSYSFPWDENTNSLVQFVESALRRFAIPE